MQFIVVSGFISCWAIFPLADVVNRPFVPFFDLCIISNVLLLPRLRYVNGRFVEEWRENKNERDKHNMIRTNGKDNKLVFISYIIVM